jgi:Cu(I)/Ag(I) efflux system membrane protein CusA/SilA
VTGDIRSLVIEPCRTVGRPIFFSVMIMLLSFVPVFMLSGREGKLFHPLAFTKSFAMIGVALISITVVPALIPTFIKGRLRGEEENPIVRSFINIYKPLLTWALPRRNLVMWMFAVLLILAAGMFPLQALVGRGASEEAWRATFLGVFGLVTALTVVFTRGLRWQLLSFATLVIVALWSFHFTKIGVAFMPALDEGTTLDMPVTVPRASVTQAADDLKARDALLRGFPEVESVIGKSGRADTPTDPAPLDMVETFVNFRPKELWPKRVLKYDDAVSVVDHLLVRLEEEGFVGRVAGDERTNLVNNATQKALERFDEVLRELALRRYDEFRHDLGKELVRFAVVESISRMEAAGHIGWPAAIDQDRVVEQLVAQLTPDHAMWLAESPALEDVAAIVRATAQNLHEAGAIADVAASLEVRPSWAAGIVTAVAEAFGGERATLPDNVLNAVEHERTDRWQAQVKRINWELFDRAAEAFPAYAVEELAHEAAHGGDAKQAPRAGEFEEFSAGSRLAQLGKPFDAKTLEPVLAMRPEFEEYFRKGVFLWPRQTGPKGDLVDDEMGRVLQVPGWSNIFTQPIINRIEMLSTGVRTDIGIKVFGPDLDTIVAVCRDIEAALKPISGARDVLAAPVMGKGYLEVDIDRRKAARYGISVEDIQSEIEMAMAGRAVTYTVEKRDRFPVRIRYARGQREDEESLRRLLVGPGGAQMNAVPAATAMSSGERSAIHAAPLPAQHSSAPEHAGANRSLVPLSAVADVRIVEGPAMIKSENGALLNYVTLNVRGRDIVGFVDEAQRVVAQKVKLAEGVHIAWSGEFEHQVRAARTLRIVFPAVIALIFIILYLTYKDLADASLMMLAVPEALAGGAFFMFLFPKIMNGWSAPPMDFSVAVWVGFIACFGMATETGIIMLVYLREAIDKRGGLENIQSLEELREAVIEGAVHRLRPKLLTEGVAIIAIFPMVFATGVGGEILAPMALPVLGGLLISDEVVDLFLPVRFYWVRRARWLKMHESKKTRAASQQELAGVECAT